VQTCIEPDILIIDEVLSVGDIFFQQKCFARLDELLAQDTAVIIVSHDMALIEKYSTRTLLLDHGQAHFLGHPNEAVQRFYVLDYQKRHPAHSTQSTQLPNYPITQSPITNWPQDESFSSPETAGLIGGQSAVLHRVALCKEDGRPSHLFQTGETAHFFYEIELLEDIQTPVSGITLTNSLNINVHGKNTAQHLLTAPETVKKGSRIRFHQTFQLHLAQGQYTYSIGFSSISPADYGRFPELPYAYYHEKANVLFIYQNAGSFQITLRSQPPDLPFHGTADLPGTASLTIHPPT
jgi:ABC-type glutathione transport system ATPase component